jgi:hypothetical protein
MEGGAELDVDYNACKIQSEIPDNRGPITQQELPRIESVDRVK